MIFVKQRLGRFELLKLKTRALRRRVWLRALSSMERGLVEAVIRTLDAVRSNLLAKILLRIAEKLSLAMESRVSRAIREVGRSLAQKAGLIALSWGNESARDWQNDQRFARHLAVIAANNPPMFRS